MVLELMELTVLELMKLTGPTVAEWMELNRNLNGVGIDGGVVMAVDGKSGEE